MVYFYGTLQCTTSSMVIDSDTLRTYTVAGPDASNVVTALARRCSTEPGTLCVELPADVHFHAVVMGRTNPSFAGETDLPEPPGALGSTWSAMPMLPGSWGRLVFLAPDGSNYGSGMDDQRSVFGLYPAALVTASDPPGADSIAKSKVTAGMPALQCGTNVVLVARSYDAAAVAHLDPSYAQYYSWHISPGAAPPATMILARQGTDAWGDSHAEYNAALSYGGFSLMAFNLATSKWDLATVVPTSLGGTDATARNDRATLGVLLGINGPSGGSTMSTQTICTAGRFWVNPDVQAFLDNTPYYVDSTAQTGAGSAGLQSPDPCAFGCRRPVFFHFTSGWCEMYPQGIGPGQRFRYDPDAGQEAIIDADFDPTSSQSRVAYRDFGFNAAADPGSTGTETDEVMAWFLHTTVAANRAVVVKRGDLVIDIDSNGSGSTADLADRGGRLCFPYTAAERVTTAYVPGTPWFTVAAYSPSSSTTSGELVFRDGTDVMLTWGGDTTLANRYFQFNKGITTSWMDDSNVERVRLSQADLTAVLAAGFSGVLYLRTIEVCGPGGPTDIKHIAILASDEF